MGRRRLSAAPALEKTTDHGGARIEAETHGSTRRRTDLAAPRSDLAAVELHIGIHGAPSGSMGQRQDL